MAKVQVFRIETLKGNGPYCADDWQDLPLRGLMYIPQAHPTPEEDYSMGERAFYSMMIRHAMINDASYAELLFCFPTMDSLMNWFFSREDREVLRDSGFHVSVYECEEKHVVKSLKQACFIKGRENFVKRIPIPA